MGATHFIQPVKATTNYYNMDYSDFTDDNGYDIIQAIEEPLSLSQPWNVTVTFSDMYNVASLDLQDVYYIIDVGSASGVLTGSDFISIRFVVSNETSQAGPAFNYTRMELNVDFGLNGWQEVDPVNYGDDASYTNNDTLSIAFDGQYLTASFGGVLVYSEDQTGNFDSYEMVDQIESTYYVAVGELQSDPTQGSCNVALTQGAPSPTPTPTPTATPTPSPSATATPTSTPSGGGGGGGFNGSPTPTPTVKPPNDLSWLSANLDYLVLVGAVGVGALLYFSNKRR